MKNRIILLVFFITNVLCYAQQTSSIFDPPVKPPVIDIPITEINDNTVSAMPSNVDVTPMGAASYSIPIQVPPGTNGFQPNIAISYNSQAGFGAMGIGWNISGLSQIERGGKNFYHDGPKVEKNHITFTDEDQLYLDGQRLILLSGKHMKLGAVYGFEVENYARVTIKHVDFQQSIYNHGLCLELKTKEGAIIQYAANNYISYKGLNNNTLYWKISKSIDVHGNVINYEYSKDYRTLKRITYAKGANSIEFKYLPNDKNPQKKYIKNFELVNDSLLSSIQIKQGGVYVDKYKFNYEVADTYKRLVSIDYSVFKAFQVGKEPIFTTDQQTDSASTYPVQNHNTANNGTLSGFKYLNTTRIGWGENATLQNVEVESGFVPDYDRMYIGDIDGDGKNDYIYLNYSDNSDCYIRVKFRKTGKLQQIAFNKYSKQKPMLLIQDVNLNGRDDVVLLYEKKGEIYLKLFMYASTNDELVIQQDIQLTQLILGYPFFAGDYIEHKILSAFFCNINKDKYPDLRILADKYWNEAPVFDPTDYSGAQIKTIGEFTYDDKKGFTFIADENYGGFKYFDSRDIDWGKEVLGDFDADGSIDCLHVNAKEYPDNITNNYYSFNIVESSDWRRWKVGGSVQNIDGDWIKKAMPLGIDINSDNRTDLLIQYYQKDNLRWKVLKSNGLYSSPDMESVDLIEASMTVEADNDYKIPIDYNGDGLMDFVVADECHDPINKRERRFTHTKWWFYKNDNGKLVQDKVFITNYEISYKSNEERHPVVADINNDGVDDIVYYENGRIKAFTMYEANKTNLVNSITDGVGRTYQFDYKYHNTLGFKENTELQYAGDFKIFKKPLTVVASMNWNGRPQIEYSYGKMLYNITKGLMGFDKIFRYEIFYRILSNSLIVSSDIRCTEMFFEPVGRNRYFNMMLREKSIYNSYNYYDDTNKKLESTTKYTNSNIEIDRLRYIPVTTKEVYYDALTGQSKTVNHTYETNKVRQKGVLLRTYVVTGKNSQKTEYSDFVPNVHGIVDFLPKTKTVTYSNGDIQNNIVYKTRYQYNSKYQVINSVEFADKPENISTVFDYYPSGNLRQKTVSVVGLSKQTTTYHYDKLFRLPIKVVNSIGQYTQNIYDYRNGNVLTSIDIDGSTTYYTYNIDGQLKTKTSPNGQRTSYTRTFARHNDYGALYKVTETLNEPNMVTTTYYDVFDREVYKTQTGANGVLLHSYKRYNYKNQLADISGFHEKSESNPLNTYYMYDDYNRLSQQKVFDGVFTNREEYLYSGKTITVKDAIDQTNISTKIFNSEGLVERQQDRGGTIYYTYDAEGRPLSIKANGATIELKYDAYGNRIYLKDPNAGAVTSEYFANGLIRKHTNAKGDITTYEYDVLHRVSKETITEATGKIYTFEYKYTPYGEIADVVYKEGGVDRHRRTFAYNKDNLLESVTDIYEGDTYKRSFGYDKYWRLIREVSPSGLVTENTYDRYGNISEVKVNGVSVWKLNDQDAKGAIRKFTLGNNICSEYKYKPNGLLESIITQKQDNGAIRSNPNKQIIQNLVYDYDRRYNLIQRNDLIYKKNETFEYDNIDRLTEVCVNEGETKSIRYQPNGNIDYKHDVGRYIYDPIRPYAVGYISGQDKGISDTEQRLEYNAYNKVTRVSQADTEYAIEYGLDRERIKTVHKENGNIKRIRLYFGSYEKEVESPYGIITHTDYIYTPSGLTAIYKQIGKLEVNYYVHCDNIGSVNVVTDQWGNITNRYYYTPWGGRTRIKGNVDITDRGYTGHEHLTALSLINMNGRIYDPVLARFLSPDPYVQAPDFTQNYNRYTYCLNNPFKYTDPSGEWALIDDIIAAVVGGVANLVVNLIQGNVQDAGHGAALFGVGAAGAVASLYVSPVVGAGFVSGANNLLNQGFKNDWKNIDAGQVFFSTALGMGTSYFGGMLGNALSQPISNITSGITSPILRETLTHGLTNATTGFALSAGMAWFGGADFNEGLRQGGIGALTGAGIGIMNGTVSAIQYANENHINVFTGKEYIAKNVVQNFKSHAFAGGRHDDLGLSKDEVSNNVETFVIKNKLSLKEGTNVFQGKINGIEKSIVVNLHNGHIRSLNMYPGYSQRHTLNPVIKFDNLRW